MTKLQIPPLDKPRQATDKWRRWGVSRNPFPESGVGLGVDYTDHLQDGQIEAINAWLQDTLGSDQTQWQPLALKGSVGVGKTHWLKSIELLIQSHVRDHKMDNRILISRHGLTGVGMRSLSLGALLYEGLSKTDLIERCLRNFHKMSADNHPEAVLGTASPLFVPLGKLRRTTGKETDEFIDLFRSWLLRSKLSPTKLTRLGVNERLEMEGQWVRAQAHICRLAARVGSFHVWIVLLDQLEDLWRRDVTTPLRRARFLSDLRVLIDEAYEGSPIAVAMAWNTASAGDRSTPPDVERQLRKDYYALFTRIHGDRVIEFPRLPREHALPFANAYIDHAALREHGSERALLQRQMRDDLSQLLDGLGADKEIIPRAWLQTLHGWVRQLPSEPPKDAKKTPRID